MAEFFVEMPESLRDLLSRSRNDKDDGVKRYFHLIESKKDTSVIRFYGKPILPILLSEDDKIQMQEFRKAAVKVEQKLFEVQREKYSSLLMQVNDVMDRVKRNIGIVKNRKPYTQAEKGHPRPESISTLSDKLVNRQHDALTTHGYQRASERTSDVSNSRNNLSTSTLLPVKKYPGRLTESISKSSDATLRNTMDSVLFSTRHTDSIINAIPGAPEASLLSQVAVSVYGEGGNVDDSLASTNLSMAFTDVSVASLQSTAGNQPGRPVQRQLNMDTINNNLYQTHQRQPLTSTPTTSHAQSNNSITDTNTRKNMSGVMPGKGAQGTKAAQSSRSTGPSHHVFSKNISSKHSSSRQDTTGDQDKALEKLDMMRKKLLQEKEKQLHILRQQELSRLRQKSAESLDGSFEGRDAYQDSVARATSNITSMYSIAECSHEESMSKTNAEESTSDKENVPHCSHGNNERCYDNTHMTYGNLGNDYSVLAGEEICRYVKPDKVWDGYPHALGRGYEESTPRGKSTVKHAGDLYIRHEFVKQMEELGSQEGSELHKFAVLSAHAKGFLTRRLLQADKVQALVKTVKDTQAFLSDIAREGTQSTQEKMLNDRVTAQLDAARGKLHDVFFKIPVTDRMAYIAHARSLAKERAIRQASKKSESRRLSAATMKAMQRRQDGTQGGGEPKKVGGVSAHPGRRRSWDIRVLKPTQSQRSPTLAEKRKARRSLGGRPATMQGGRSATTQGERPKSQPGTDGEKTQLRRPTRTSREEKPLTKRPARVSQEERPQRPTRSSAEEKAPPKRARRSRSAEREGGDGVRSGEERVAARRPQRMSLGANRQPSIALKDGGNVPENKPRTGPITRKVAKSMAARFDKL
ncbi:uncharacterized protein LOC116616954 isoform X2 [Nematostella vectensis]|uniref:uncharacterized protein LOC116616954 isoform X2 n=1 Tax=Nematostella vectensis TaxID=45351 RepID=UPI00207768D9|nr:uncharacterized protein LOC116616954 isoform X2 [Nematostella vectensis]